MDTSTAINNSVVGEVCQVRDLKVGDCVRFQTPRMAAEDTGKVTKAGRFSCLLDNGRPLSSADWFRRLEQAPKAPVPKEPVPKEPVPKAPVPKARPQRRRQPGSKEQIAEYLKVLAGVVAERTWPNGRAAIEEARRRFGWAPSHSCILRHAPLAGIRLPHRSRPQVAPAPGAMPPVPAPVAPAPAPAPGVVREEYRDGQGRLVASRGGDGNGGGPASTDPAASTTAAGACLDMADQVEVFAGRLRAAAVLAEAGCRVLAAINAEDNQTTNREG